MTEQKTLLVGFAAAALAGGGGFVAGDIGGETAEVRQVVAEDIYPAPTVAHLSSMKAARDCQTQDGGPDVCRWLVSASTVVPSLIPGVQARRSSDSFYLDEKADLEPIVRPLIDAANVRYCQGEDGQQAIPQGCQVETVYVQHATHLDASKPLVAYVSGNEWPGFTYTPDAATMPAIVSLVGNVIDVLCQSGGLCPGAAASPDADGGA